MKEVIPQFKHPPLFEVKGSVVSSEEVNRRLKIVFDKLPRLWTDYAARVVPYIGNPTIDAEIMARILDEISLRPEVFLEWKTDYFDEQQDEMIRIAKERGSHLE